MKKLTAEKCCQILDYLNSNGMSILEGYYVEALEIALPILERQEREEGEGEWIEWGGGECPCDYRSVVEVRLRSGNERMARGALSWEWKHHNSICDIIAYRIIPEQPTNQNGEQ